jgi:natural resistance-associated macrophage protein
MLLLTLCLSRALHAVLSFVINVFIVSVFAEAFYNKPGADASLIDLLSSVRLLKRLCWWREMSTMRACPPVPDGGLHTPLTPSLVPDFFFLPQGQKLEEVYGTAFKYIWAIGLLAAGQSSTMTGTYAGVCRRGSKP